MNYSYVFIFYLSLNAFQGFEAPKKSLTIGVPYGAISVKRCKAPNPAFDKLLVKGLELNGFLTDFGVDAAIVEAALKAGAKPNIIINQVHNKVKPLHLAALNGKIEVARILLAHKADPMPLDNGGNTPLHVAIASRRTAFAQFMIENLAKFKQGPQVNPLLEMLERHEQWSPLQMACWFNDAISCELLLKHGAKPDSKLRLYGIMQIDGPFGGNSYKLYHRSPLHIAISNGDLAITKMLLDNGAAKDLICYSSGTPLHIAAKEGDKMAVELLLANNVDASLPNHKGLTALSIADDPEVKKLLKEHIKKKQLTACAAH
jgi:ankyrin repeat protein